MSPTGPISPTAARTAEHAHAKRVLVYRLGSLGDTVIALPALHLVECAFPQAERRMLTSFPLAAKAPPSSAILEHTGLIHGYFRYSYGTRNICELLTLWWTIVRWRPEVLVYLNGPRGIASAKRDALFFRLCGIRTLIGLPVTQDMQHSRLLPGPDPGNAEDKFLEYECSRLARNLVQLGDAHLEDPKSWDLRLTTAERERAAQVLEPTEGCAVLAASIGTKMQSKDWGPENWRKLIERLAVLYPNHALALCGAREEAAASEFVAEAWRGVSSQEAVNVCGLLSPRESAALFSMADLFIGHDSGPMHLAASVQTPCVAVFSARNLPNVWFPYGPNHRVIYHHVDCGNCDLETCIVEQKKCILSITVDEVLKEVMRVLRTSG